MTEGNPKRCFEAGELRHKPGQPKLIADESSPAQAINLLNIKPNSDSNLPKLALMVLST